MVYVMLGTQSQQFTRIIDYVINCETLKNEQVIIQAGSTKYKKDYDKDRIKIITFVSKENLEESIKKSTLVITHAGISSIFLGINNKKKTVVVPRLKKYLEHVDDHQLEICSQLEKEGYILYLHENSQEDFNLLINKSFNYKFKEYVNNKGYIEILKKEI